MGIVSTSVRFDERTPDPRAIAAAVSELCGLPVSVAVKGAPGDTLFAMNVRLAFDAAPDVSVELFSYRHGVEGPAGSPLDGRTVHLRSYIGQELTMYWTAALSLERIGGTIARSPSDEIRQRYGRRLTRWELRGRVWKLRAATLAVLPIAAVALPVNLVVWTVRGLWSVGRPGKGGQR